MGRMFVGQGPWVHNRLTCKVSPEDYLLRVPASKNGKKKKKPPSTCFSCLGPGQEIEKGDPPSSLDNVMEKSVGLFRYPVRLADSSPALARCQLPLCYVNSSITWGLFCSAFPLVS